MKNFDFLIHELKQRKNFSLEFVLVQNTGNLKPCDVLVKQPAENVINFRQKDCWAQAQLINS